MFPDTKSNTDTRTYALSGRPHRLRKAERTMQSVKKWMSTRSQRRLPEPRRQIVIQTGHVPEAEHGESELLCEDRTARIQSILVCNRPTLSNAPEQQVTGAGRLEGLQRPVHPVCGDPGPSQVEHASLSEGREPLQRAANGQDSGS